MRISDWSSDVCSSDLVRYIAVPKTSSESRAFVPIAFLDPEVIASTELFTISGGNLFELGTLSSTMHMAWLRNVGGRLKSDYRYSAGIVYNNFPWPEAVDDKYSNAIRSEERSAVKECVSTCRTRWHTDHQ